MGDIFEKRIAVIGGGVAGLTVAWLLQQQYDVTLFERSARIGGNAYTLTTPEGLDADIAVAVFGRSAYPNLLRLFTRLNIPTTGPFRRDFCLPAALGAGFYDLDAQKGLFLTPALSGLLAQKFKVLRPRHAATLLLLWEGLRKANRMLGRGELKGLSVQDMLELVPEWTGDAKLILINCLCLISSMHCDDLLEAPADFFIGKMKVHSDFIPPRAFFSVFFPKNRTKSYVDALSAGYREKIIFNAAISRVFRRENRVRVVMKDGEEKVFGSVVFACNADQALDLLAEPTPDERRLLGAWKYTEGRVVVHDDNSLFPKRELMDGYTFLYRKQGKYIRTSVSGSLRVLPGMPKTCGLISTQHPHFPIRPDRVVFETVFRTPLFDARSCATVPELASLNGVNNTYYCGSHFGFGLHEDAVTSAINAARMLGVTF